MSIPGGSGGAFQRATTASRATSAPSAGAVVDALEAGAVQPYGLDGALR
jgi:hypothetical protein